MLSKLFFKIIEKLMLQIISSSRPIRDEVIKLCDLYYKKNSLSVYRVWGAADRLFLGEGVQANNAIFNTSSGKISIGDYAFFGHCVTLLTGIHDINKKDAERQRGVPDCGRDICIGNGVWIASNVTIVGPCTIGAHAVIGAGSVVLGDVPAGAFYAGVPACEVKKIIFNN